MAEIILSTSGTTWAMGWYGTCPGDQPFELDTIKEKLFSVYLVNSFSSGPATWKPDAGQWTPNPYDNLEFGYAYLIIFNSTTTQGETINIPGFTRAYHPGFDSGYPPPPKPFDDPSGNIINACGDTSSVTNSPIPLSTSGTTWAMGWYGTCPGDQPFELDTIKEKLFSVYLVNSFSSGPATWKPDAGQWTPNPYDNLEVGYVYLIIFNSTTTQGETINIPGFTRAYHPGFDSGYPPPPKPFDDPSGVIVETCDSTPPGPEPACAVITTLKNNNSIAEIVIDWNEVTNDGTQNGKIQAVEVVFDNIVFQQGATTSGAAGKPVVTADWGGISNSEINSFKSSTGGFKDYAIRSDGTLASHQISTFGMLSLGNPLTLTSYQNTPGSVWTFEVPVASVGPDTTGFGTEPVIADIRVYDTSTNLLKYGVTEC